jgi:hypothetical protein
MMENQDKEFRRIAFLANLHKGIDEVERVDKEKADELKQKFYDLANFKEAEIIHHVKENSKTEDSEVLSNNLDESSEKPHKKENKKHNPFQVSPFLHAFTAKEPLKFLTHTWDDNLPPFDYKKFIEEARYQFNDLIKRYPDLPQGLVAKIRLFAFLKEFKNNQGWSEEKIPIGWSTTLIKDILLQHPGYSPLSKERLEFKPPITVRDGTNYRYFNDIVKKFKSEIEFRSDLENDLETIIRLIVSKLSSTPDYSFLSEFKLDFKGVQKGISLYTDIEKVKQAIRYVLKAIPSETPFKEIEFSFRDFNDSKEVKLVILHRGSMIAKSFGSFKEKIRNESGETLGKVPGLLRSLCDWDLVTKFGDDGNVGKYTILPEGDFEEISSEKFEGVKHVLTFYRSE